MNIINNILFLIFHPIRTGKEFKGWIKSKSLHIKYILVIINIIILSNAYFTARAFWLDYIQVNQLILGVSADNGGEIQAEPGVACSLPPESEFYTVDWALKQWENRFGKKVALEAFAVIQNESGWEAQKWNCNSKGSMASLDLGYYQFNSQHFLSGLLTMDCALNLKCSTEKALNLYAKNGWSSWNAAKRIGIK